MRLNDIITQGETKSRSRPARLGSEERLEDLFFDGVGDAGAVVGDGDFYFIAFYFCRNLYFKFLF